VLLRLRYAPRGCQCQAASNRGRGGQRQRFDEDRQGYFGRMELLLWILAVVLVVAGVLALFRRQILWGVVLIIVGLLVGPGGVSMFT
jgi:hypothetical protein